MIDSVWRGSSGDVCVFFSFSRAARVVTAVNISLVRVNIVSVLLVVALKKKKKTTHKRDVSSKNLFLLHRPLRRRLMSRLNVRLCKRG